MRSAIQMTALDRAIAAVSPGRALKRLQARTALNAISAAPARTAGSQKGTMNGWAPRWLGKLMEARQRELAASRTQELVANDASAAAIVDTMPTNVVGYGLSPQSEPHADILGLTEEQAQAFANRAEWLYRLWSRTADLSGRMTVWDMQFLGVRNLMVYGEALRIPVMLPDEPGRRFSLSFQDVSPLRLKTPPNLQAAGNIRDGVELGPGCTPVAYYIADPQRDATPQGLGSADFTRFPARRGHWPAVMHLYRVTESEQVRGVSPLAPALKTFKDLEDYMDYELVGAIVAANFPVYFEPIAGQAPFGAGLPRANNMPTGYELLDMEMEPGAAYSGPGRPHMLKSERPSGTFASFTETFLRAVCAVTGQPYEVVSKTFQNNYSASRAALNEAWKTYQLYRAWLGEHDCQPVWEMLLEECYLRGYLDDVMPGSAPGFYSEREAWCNATWIGPARGSVDPAKEEQGRILELINGTTTRKIIAAEKGRDWDRVTRQRRREEAELKAAGIPSQLTTKAASKTDQAETQGAPENA